MDVLVCPKYKICSCANAKNFGTLKDSLLFHPPKHIEHTAYYFFNIGDINK